MGDNPAASLPRSCNKCEFEGLCAQAPGPFFLLLLLEQAFFFASTFLAVFSHKLCTDLLDSLQRAVLHRGF